MTGIFVRIEKTRSWRNVEIDELTDEEMTAFIDQQRKETADDGWNWVRMLARWIRDHSTDLEAIKTSSGSKPDT